MQKAHSPFRRCAYSRAALLGGGVSKCCPASTSNRAFAHSRKKLCAPRGFDFPFELAGKLKMSETKSSRGGKRTGAGRKPKGYVRPASIAEIDLAHALTEPPPDEIEPVAQRHDRDALETLVKQLTCGKSEAASVAAANA